jgi:hypothetical protein
MARARSQSLVIDTSVARAAGPEDAAHPTAKHCRDFLLAVLDICHRATFSDAIAEEWRNHQSGFARQWRVSMFARKKIDRLDIPEDDALREQLKQAAASEKQQAAMLKDAHLLEAAVARGMRVAALDETVRNYFRQAALSVRVIRQVCWVNPACPEEDPLEWLRDGAPANRHRMLGHAPREG